MRRKILMACLLAAGLASCGQVRQVVQPGAQPSPRTDGPITLSGSTTLSSPAPGQPTATPATQNWRRDLPRNIAYFNMGSDAVSIYSEAERTTATGTLLPGEGGYIQTCDDAKPVCKMSFGNGRTGWVAMGSMAGVSNG